MADSPGGGWGVRVLGGERGLEPGLPSSGKAASTWPPRKGREPPTGTENWTLVCEGCVLLAVGNWAVWPLELEPAPGQGEWGCVQAPRGTGS